MKYARPVVVLAVVVWLSSGIVLATGNEAAASNLAQATDILWIVAITLLVVAFARDTTED